MRCIVMCEKPSAVIGSAHDSIHAPGNEVIHKKTVLSTMFTYTVTM